MKSNNKNNQDNLSILSSSLFQLCSKQSNGTLFILTDRNTSAQIVLQDSSVIAFSFEDKHGIEAIKDFQDATYTRSQFMENYHFPLTTEANIHCSDSLLSELGYNEFLIDKTNQKRRRFRFKYAKRGLFNTGEFDYALERLDQFA